MFTNIFAYFGPMWSAVLLLGVGVLPFLFALAATLQLAQPAHQRLRVPMIRLIRTRQRLAESLAALQVGSRYVPCRCLSQLSAAVGRRGPRRR